MVVVELRVLFHLSACRSLKDKRSRMKGLKERFGRHTGLAVCESDYADSLQRAQWSFVAVAAAIQPVQQMLDEVEQYVRFSLDAQVVEATRVPLVAPYRSMADAEDRG